MYWQHDGSSTRGGEVLLLATMKPPILHFCTPGNPAALLYDRLKVKNGRELLGFLQEMVGDRYRVRGQPAVLDAVRDDERGGRSDDRARVREINEALANDAVAALVTLRGGAWLTRILPDVKIDLLSRRRRPLAVFGFSEITTLVNLVGSHAKGRGYYDVGPAFIRDGMERFARLNPGRALGKTNLTGKRLDEAARRYAEAGFLPEFRKSIENVIRIIEGKPPRRLVGGRLVQGRLPAASRVTIVGGCLSLVTPLTVEHHARRIRPAGKWILLEDLEEHPHRIDRQFAHLKLAGWFEKCAGVLIGDFHLGDENQEKLVLEILKYHLPAKRNLPVVVTRDVGHVWPYATVPIGRRVTLRRRSSGKGKAAVRIEWPDA